jgi:hypothetical protein
MTVSHRHSDLGYGINASDYGTYRWNSHAFNPAAECSSQGWNPWTESWSTYTGVTDKNTSFNLNGYYYGHEAVLHGLSWNISGTDSGYVYFDWYDPNNDLLFSFSSPWGPQTGGWWAAWAGIGIKEDGAEIHMNGTYTVAWQVTGSNTISGYDYPVITNHPPGTAVTAGHLWVEGTRLCFGNYQGYKTYVMHDGIEYATGLTAYQGHIWLETDGKISYIDNSGVERRTKMGDRYGWYPDPYELPGSGLTSYAGHIWVSSGYYTDTFLCIVSSNGVKYRIGVGYRLTGDYQ